MEEKNSYAYIAIVAIVAIVAVVVMMSGGSKTTIVTPSISGGDLIGEAVRVDSRVDFTETIDIEFKTNEYKEMISRKYNIDKNELVVVLDSKAEFDERDYRLSESGLLEPIVYAPGGDEPLAIGLCFCTCGIGPGCSRQLIDGKWKCCSNGHTCNSGCGAGYCSETTCLGGYITVK